MRKCKCGKRIPFHRFRKCKCHICQNVCAECTDKFIDQVMKDVVAAQGNEKLKPLERL